MKHSSIKKIAVFRALQLGDMLCAIPAIKALHELFPNARITLIGLPWSSFIVTRYSEYLHDFIAFPGMEGLPEQEPNEGAFDTFLQKVKAEAFDLVIQLQGSGTVTNTLLERFEAKFLAGSYLTHKPSTYFIKYDQNIHEIHRLLAVIKTLGQVKENERLYFPITDLDKSALRFARLDLLPHSYVCIHPGARDPKRRWSTQYFSWIGDMLAAKGFYVVLTGTKDELPLVQEVKQQMRSKAIIAAGKLDLGGLAALIKNAALFISNCTGVAHLSTAVQTPTIVLSLEKEPWRWAPLDQDKHRTIVIENKTNVAKVMYAINDFVEASIHHPIMP